MLLIPYFITYIIISGRKLKSRKHLSLRMEKCVNIVYFLTSACVCLCVCVWGGGEGG